MATTQPGGVYKVGDKLVDAQGKETKKLSEKEAERAAATVTDPAAADTGDTLAEDFPHRELLVAANLSTRTAVSGTSDEDVLAIKGIGPAALKEIRKALK